MLHHISEAKTNSHIDESLGCKAWRRLSQPSKSYIYLEKSHIPRTQLTSIFEGQPDIFSVLGFWSGLGPVAILVLGHWTGYIFKIQRFSQEFTTKLLVFSTRGSRTKPAETSPLLWEKRPKPIQSKNFGMIPDDFWPTKKELLKTRPYLADPSTGHPLCSFVRDPNEVLDILDRSWRKPFTVSNYQFFHDLLAWYQKSWTFHMVGERFFGFWSDCFWILPTISPFESWMYLCFLVNIKKINSIFPRTFASCSITHHHHPFRWCLLTVSGSVFFSPPATVPTLRRGRTMQSVFFREEIRGNMQGGWGVPHDWILVGL